MYLIYQKYEHKSVCLNLKNRSKKYSSEFWLKTLFKRKYIETSNKMYVKKEFVVQQSPLNKVN
jgi:hypothetical protein